VSLPEDRFPNLGAPGLKEPEENLTVLGDRHGIRGAMNKRIRASEHGDGFAGVNVARASEQPLVVRVRRGACRSAQDLVEVFTPELRSRRPHR
jgi:hypothetical protein